MDNKPLISICIPVYNRLEPIKYTVPSLLKQIEEDGNGLFEVVFSVNPSKDGVEAVSNYVNTLADNHKIKVNINEQNIGGSLNILKAIECAKGKFVWVIGDDDLILPGTIKRIVYILQSYEKVTWIFINSARVAGAIEDRNAPVVTPVANEIEEGFFKDGKKKVAEVFKKIDGGLLFSTSNIYLKSSVEQIVAKYSNDCYQLAYTFSSASQGEAFIIAEPCILAGGNITWGDKNDYIQIRRMNDDLYAAAEYGYSALEMKNIIRYRMKHSALRSWFVIFKMILKKDSMGIIAYKKLFELMPVFCLLITIFSPVFAGYLVLRHSYRNYKRRQVCEKYKNSPDAKQEILERII